MFKSIVKKLFVSPLRRFIEREAARLAAVKCQDIPAERQRRALETTADFVEQHLTAIRAVRTRDEILDVSLEALPADADGLCCEFGVFQGGTITRMAQQLPNRKFYGFDSFEGLPEDWKPGCGKGAFDLKGIMPVVPSNVELIKGWFDQTLPGFLSSHPGKVSFLHVDCDLYSSTKCIFDLLGDRLTRGSVILFDEYFNYPGWQEGEHKAWLELIAARGLTFEYIAYNEMNEQLAVRLL